ncbi:hypothetical protein HDU84_006341 [Entophlyctis sp. JEL0112]|nr:hypothetical protein HDU84_006341 [Entophlyctis sp. JEL0112]
MFQPGHIKSAYAAKKRTPAKAKPKSDIRSSQITSFFQQSELPEGWRKTFSTRPDGRQDVLYHGPDGLKFRSMVATGKENEETSQNKVVTNRSQHPCSNISPAGENAASGKSCNRVDKPTRESPRSGSSASISKHENRSRIEESDSEDENGVRTKKRRKILQKQSRFIQESDSSSEMEIIIPISPEMKSDTVTEDTPLSSRKHTASPSEKKQSFLSLFFGGAPPSPTKNSKQHVKRKSYQKKAHISKRTKQDDEAEVDEERLADLEPINKLADMFDDMITRVPKLADNVKQLHSSRPPLRIATMCSGTESPLLAIKLISDSLSRKLNIPHVLRVHHVFSCEIEPFKQAYIDRNFQPPILFRDVRQLGSKSATTAYGACVEVPGCVDILIAGTSCVDYSNLNNKKQTIDAKGESGETFRGMLAWVKTHRPPIVILENVCNAPWDKVVELFDGIGYDATFTRTDTKRYYIPHTRTRVYLIALSRDKEFGYVEEAGDEWRALLKSMARNASTPVEDFLLATDDPRIHHARQELAKVKNDSSANRRIDWARCESRHAFARINEELGSKRPLTAWSEGGMSNYPDFAWNDWGRTQPDRVLDLSDINFLREAKRGIDVTYKTLIWNLSQNVDRNSASSNPGISPCLTPSMIAYITNRGGPLVGLEALSLQGIPIDELLLTRETEDQLADLAGNAMTSTVVGAVFLAALSVGIHGLVSHGKKLERMLDRNFASTAVPENRADCDSRVSGCESLEIAEMNLGIQNARNFKDILTLACLSSRRCVCEGRDGLSRNKIQVCRECNHSSCVQCGGRPEHVYDESLICHAERKDPAFFTRELKDSLPMRLILKWISPEEVLEIAQTSNISTSITGSAMFPAWSQIVTEALVPSAEFRFSYLKRQDIWTAVFASKSARLVLTLDTTNPHWQLFVHCPQGASTSVREALKNPVAQMSLSQSADSYFCGDWSLFLPIERYSFKVSICGEGDLVDSWESKIGLEGPYQGTTVWSKWTVKNICNDVSLPLGGIDGTYRSIGKCGTAMDYLHVRDKNKEGQKMFFFLDPSRCGLAATDSFVFATQSRRLDYGEQRLPVAVLDPSWRPHNKSGEIHVDCSISGLWVAANGSVRLNPFEDSFAKTKFSVMSQNWLSHCQYPQTTFPCDLSTAIVSVQVDLQNFVEDVWANDNWNEVNLSKNGKYVFQQIAWFCERIAMPSWMHDWVCVDAATLHLEDKNTHNKTPCQKCAPSPPAIIWVPSATGKSNGFIAVEDPSQAGIYENALKNRPTPFESAAKTKLLNSLYLTSNRKDPQVDQPPDFKNYPLRPEQLRSLGWMIRQEEHPVGFIEEEISEASLDYIGWRAEGRVSRKVTVRGGVVADEVGYGKTAITIGLIDHFLRSQGVSRSFQQNIFGKISVKATLVLVPGHLLKQWPNEIEKFTGNALKTIVIGDVSNLNKLSIQDIMKADIVVASSKIFVSQKYWDNVEVLGARGKFGTDTKNGGRYFNAQYQDCLANLKQQVEKLKNGDIKGLITEIESAMDVVFAGSSKSKSKGESVIQKKRLKGKKYRETIEGESANANESSEAETEEAAGSNRKPPKLGQDKFPDPWRLTTSDIQKSWKNMKCPPFELFSWNRVVVDEFTYLNGRIHSAILNLSAENRWILSGTPPVKDFNDIKSIAVFLGVHLGVDDESDFAGQKAKKRRKESTRVEQFHAFREIHTSEWHQNRHQIAQSFLNQFVRQNIAEIDEIFTEEVVCNVVLPPAERALYLELEHHLQALDMNSRKAIKMKNGMDGDRDRRMVKALGNSTTAEEALMKRCSHFALDENGSHKHKLLEDEDVSGENSAEESDGEEVLNLKRSNPRSSMTAAETCRAIVSIRTEQLQECIGDLWFQINRIKRCRDVANFREDYKAHCKNVRTKDELESVDHFDKWVMMVGSAGHVGDVESMAIIVALINLSNSVDANTHGAKMITESFREFVGDRKTVNIDGNVLRIPGLADINLNEMLKIRGDESPTDTATASKRTKIEFQDEADAGSDTFEADLAKVCGNDKLDLSEVLHFIREQTHLAGRLQKELIGRVRSLRFFKHVDKIVLSDKKKDILRTAVKKCLNGCVSADVNLDDIRILVENSAVLSCCGHIGCFSCVTRASASQKCLESGCNIVVHDKAIVPTSVFGSLESGSDLTSGKFGAKLVELLRILQIRVLPQNEKALVFVQFDDLMDKVGDALESVGINYLEIKGSSKQKSTNLNSFQMSVSSKKEASVLLLNVGDESAAGANLTVANHVIFLNPLFHYSDEWIQACETQAIGRCRRYGQQRKVWIYRLNAVDTIDSVLLQRREEYRLRAK